MGNFRKRTRRQKKINKDIEYLNIRTNKQVCRYKITQQLQTTNTFKMLNGKLTKIKHNLGHIESLNNSITNFYM